MEGAGAPIHWVSLLFGAGALAAGAVAAGAVAAGAGVAGAVCTVEVGAEGLVRGAAMAAGATVGEIWRGVA
ncbi:hypothetical protein, partial [Ancylobacter vacuolatus]|uniref:hypothetical protein n=1 Tax=Ancylobacter vacuolatus TaxID=223389 RepID=UPI0036298D22